MEIPHDFFLIIPGNSTLLLVKPWKIHLLFFQCLWKFFILDPSFGVFWDTGIAHWGINLRCSWLARFDDWESEEVRQ